MEIKVIKTNNPGVKPVDESGMGFGQIFTDHMFVMEWDVENGWHDARIQPLENFSIHPASTVLHYGSEIFEGMKAYRLADNSIQLFRPIENALRMNRSAERMDLPQIEPEFFVEAVRMLVDIDRDWVPHTDGTSLYIRPFMFSNDVTLHIHTSKKVVFSILLSPSSSYYKEGINPVKICIEDEDVRAVRGGTGFAKCGGNYAASSRATARAESKGYSQVLWLDGVEQKYVEEVGSMNIMFKIDGKVCTPVLNGSILPGITRKSILELLRSKGYEPEERKISVDELMEAARQGKLEEAWGCGTAAVVSPVGELCYKDEHYVINGNKIGPVAQELYDTLTGIQWGRVEDTFGWTVKV